MDLGQDGAGAVRGIGAGGGAELEVRLRLMERAGVEMQVLSACPQLPYGEDGKKATRAARFVNDQYAELVQRHADPHQHEHHGEFAQAAPGQAPGQPVGVLGDQHDHGQVIEELERADRALARLLAVRAGRLP